MTLIASVFMLLLCLCFHEVRSQPNVFNLRKYGGVASMSFDNSKPLMNAWSDACKWNGKGEAQIVIPRGNYFLNPVQFNGPCKGPISFLNRGYLFAPKGPTQLGYWITFRYLNGLTIDGGHFHGQGQTVWAHASDVNPGHSLMSLAFVNNTSIFKVKLMNSKKTHLTLFACTNITISHTRISSPESSPNTDGIKMAISSSISIHDSTIGSGDDCVAILNGTNNLNVTRVFCGPGHGVSIGSLGVNPGDQVRDITVRNCTFWKTMNGVRIKSWAKPNAGLVQRVTFRDVKMVAASNPVIIDQHYCPSGQCPKGDSHVQIDGVKFINIHGTSATKEAIDLQCSQSNPCKDVFLDRINLSYVGRGGGSATGVCTNVVGTTRHVSLPDEPKDKAVSAATKKCTLHSCQSSQAAERKGERRRRRYGQRMDGV